MSTGCVPRAESDVVVYSALDEEFAAPILNGFERSTKGETGIVAKFDVESTKTVGLVNQIIAEAKRPQCDLFWNNEIMHTVRLQKLGMLEPRDWNLPQTYAQDMVASDGSWCGFAARARVLLVNTDLLDDPSKYPSSVSELTDTKWKGNCAMARPLFGTTATHWAVLRERLGHDDAIEQLTAVRDNALILSGNKQVARAVSAGQVAWGLTDTDDAMIEKENGYPVAIVFPDQTSGSPGTLRIPNTVAVLRNAPHAVAAGMLADYLVSPATEDRLAMGPGNQIPLHPEHQIEPIVLPTTSVRWMRADFEAAGDDWESWADEVKTLFDAAAK